jgi:CRP-like cAMP-binding protein
MALLDDDDPTLFPKLTDEQLDLLKPYGHVRRTMVGEVLFREGDAAYDVMVLLEGRVAIVLGSGDCARDVTIHRPRDIMIELNILTGHRVQANGVVRERAFRIDQDGCSRGRGRWHGRPLRRGAPRPVFAASPEWAPRSASQAEWLIKASWIEVSRERWLVPAGDDASEHRE